MSANPIELSSRVWYTLKMAVVAPIPSARPATAGSVNPLVRASWRAQCTASAQRMEIIYRWTFHGCESHAPKIFEIIWCGMSRTPAGLRLTHENAQRRARLKRRKDMKYILMMNGTKSGWEQFVKWPKEDLQAHIGHMIQLNKELKESGELV